MRHSNGTPIDFKIVCRLVLTIVISVCSASSAVSALAQSDELHYGLTPAYGNPVSPRLELPGLDGRHYRLSDYRGRVVVVNFWATWCPPCIAELPTLQQVWKQLHTDNFDVFAVNLGEEEETIRRFIDRFEPKLEFPILLASDESIMKDWRIQALPTSYIIDKVGRWAYIELGPRDFNHEHIVSRLRKLMDASEDN